MQTIKQFIEENNLKVITKVVGVTYFCYITSEEGEFTFSMTRDKLLEHMKRFCSKKFVDILINDERFVMTHFRRLAVTWWHIQVSAYEISKEFESK